MLEHNNLGSEHLTIVAVGYIIVFISLFLLYMVFSNLPKLLNITFRSVKKSEAATPVKQEVASGELTADETAAISAAIYLFVQELHDEEQAVLTIRKLNKRYSPWSSKIYNVVNGLNKRF